MKPTGVAAGAGEGGVGVGVNGGKKTSCSSSLAQSTHASTPPSLRTYMLKMVAAQRSHVRRHPLPSASQPAEAWERAMEACSWWRSSSTCD